MAYTPINWDEVTPITPTNLNKMDNQIDTNEDDLRGHDSDIATLDSRVDGNDSDISNHESRILTNENELNTIQGGEASVDGRITQNESDIDNIENGTTKVPNASTADNALALQGNSLEVVAEGSAFASANTTTNVSPLLPSQNHYIYFLSAYSADETVELYNTLNDNFSLYAYILKEEASGGSDSLIFKNNTGDGRSVEYKVWALR